MKMPEYLLNDHLTLLKYSMKIVFVVSSVGDTNLALRTIDALSPAGQEITLISLTKAAQQQVSSIKTPLSVKTIALPELLQLDNFVEGLLTQEQLKMVVSHLEKQKVDYAYIGVPSVDNEIPFQLAESVSMPVLMAYEFMFKPDNHCLWKHVPTLSTRSNVKWAVPLSIAKDDFQVPSNQLFVTGHLSIDNAYATSNTSNNKTPQEIRETLDVSKEQSLAFISSTTQPVATDADFFDCLLKELKNHPTMQVRLGLHPGIQDLDAYLQKILAIYKKHPEIAAQFKIILPDNIASRIKVPNLTIGNPEYQAAFLRVNVTGSEAASAAGRIAQAVPGALLNQAVLEGKPTYSHLGKPYLPQKYFSNSIASFFTAEVQPPRLKKDLGLDEKTAPEIYADIIMQR
ncbi:Uncharacterised protein [Legionella feeleii]|uniref:Uncharacterized protein n=3 Tax=Legionella feeleii TaxID=453 RepID=A0A378ITZ3_9GAMM|nr:Uncharacterised protein [Legionella feeleii]